MRSTSPATKPTSISVWNELLAAGQEFGILPCGLGARNTLRLEGALSLYGHEISDAITPWEARLDRFLKMDKGEFIGRAALAEQKQRGLKRILVGLVAIERGIPRDGYQVTASRGPRDRLCHQRLARAFSQEEHRPRLRPPRAFRRRHRTGRRGAAI